MGHPLCSADSLGRIVASVDAVTLRKGIHHVYDRLKRNKALPDLYGLGVAVLDGHETSADHGYGGFLVLKKEKNEPLKDALTLWEIQGRCEIYDDPDRKEHVGVLGCGRRGDTG